FTFLQSNLNHIVSSSNLKKPEEPIAILLQACGRHKNIELGRTLHAFVSTSPRFRNDLVLTTRILTMYSTCGSPYDSRSVFDASRKKNLFLWNALLSGYTRNALFYEALFMFVDLISLTGFSLSPDNFTLPCVIKACAGLSDVKLGEGIHAFAVKTKLFSDVFVGNALIAMCGKFGLVESAVKVFERMSERNMVSWNSIMYAYSENGVFEESYGLFKRLMSGNEGLVPDVATMVTVIPLCAAQAFTFLQSNINHIVSSSNLKKPEEHIAILLQACRRHKNIELGRTLHAFVSTSPRFRNDLVLTTRILTMYSTCGSPYDSRSVFDASQKKNLFLWNALLSGYTRNALFYEALFMFVDLISLTGFSLSPDNFTLPCVIKACAGLSDVKLGEGIHAFAVKTKLFSDVFVGNALIAINLVSWNSIMYAYSENGVFEESYGLFKRLMSGNEGLVPDVATMVTVIPLCAAQDALVSDRTTTSFSLDLSKLTFTDNDNRPINRTGSYRLVAHKRRRCGSRSVSGRSGERSATRCCCSVGASAAYGACSDFSMAFGFDALVSDRTTTSFSLYLSKLTLADDNNIPINRTGSYRLIARKRRRCGSRSVSGRSGERSATRCCYSVGASAAYGVCSDFSMAFGFVSSGEIFGNRDANWASD
ncbi:hypothetical protein RYX36_013015, partial [Vicia faba]